MEYPLVSVVIPTHNRSELLLRAVRSALAEGRSDVEVIVVDDASTDGTEEMLDRVPEDALRVVRLDANVGQGEARNEGIRHARGEWIAFLDDDDEWLPGHLTGLMRRAATSPNAGVLYRPYLTAVGNRVMRFRIPLPEGRVFNDLASGWAPSLTSSMVVRRDVIGDGYDPTLVGMEDYDFWLRLADATEWAAQPAPLVIVDKTPRADRTNLAIARRLSAIDEVEQRWSGVMDARGLAEQFAATCHQIRVASMLTAGTGTSRASRPQLLSAMFQEGSVSRRTRLAGGLRLILGSRITAAMQQTAFSVVGTPRDTVVRRALSSSK